MVKVVSLATTIAKVFEHYILSCISSFVATASSSLLQVLSIHCWAARDFGAGVEQPFGCLVIQNRQVSHVLHGEVDGLDNEGQHGQRSVLLCHTHKPQKGPYPICVSRSRNVRDRCGGG